jgi:two-component system response regulator DevR
MANIDDREVPNRHDTEVLRHRRDRVDDPATPDGTVRVFLIEDHELVRRGLVDLMTAAGDLVVVGMASTAAEAVPLIAGADPAVVLLDARLGDGSGIAACRHLRTHHPELPCVLLTGAEDAEALAAAVLGGAAAYLGKQVGGSGLLDGVRAVAASRALLEHGLVERLLERLRTSRPGGAPGDLTEREHEVLELVGMGSTDGQIAGKLDLPEPDVREQVAALVTRLLPQGRPGLRGGALPAPSPALR